MKNFLNVLFIPLLFFCLSASSQPGWNWGDQVDIAKEKNAIYGDFVKSGKFAQAIAPHQWLLENTPDLNAALYQNGIKIYEGLADTEKDPVKKIEYQEKALEMYDLRIKYFGREAYVMNRKVYPAYKYYQDDKSKYPELFEMFMKTFELNGDKFSINNIAVFMAVVRMHKMAGGDVSDEMVIDIYTKLMDLIDVKKAEGKNLDALDKIAEQVDGIFSSTIDLNCDFVESILGPKLKESKDVKDAKKIFKLMLSGKCTDRPLAFDAAKIINDDQPDFSISKFLGSRASQEGDNALAVKFYNTAIEVTDENSKKAEIYLILAKMDYSAGDKISARNNCRKALAFDPSLTDAYSLIGNLYMASFEECKQGEKKTHDYAIFIAAYNQYKKAGNSEGMSKAKALFPSISDLFADTYEEGQVYQVGCWINESVTLERRPEN